MELREAAGGDADLFKAEKKQRIFRRRMLKRLQKEYEQEKEKEKNNVFSFLNSTLSGRQHMFIVCSSIWYINSIYCLLKLPDTPWASSIYYTVYVLRVITGSFDQFHTGTFSLPNYHENTLISFCFNFFISLLVYMFFHALQIYIIPFSKFFFSDSLSCKRNPSSS